VCGTIHIQGLWIYMHIYVCPSIRDWFSRWRGFSRIYFECEFLDYKIHETPNPGLIQTYWLNSKIPGLGGRQARAIGYPIHHALLPFPTRTVRCNFYSFTRGIYVGTYNPHEIPGGTLNKQTRNESSTCWYWGTLALEVRKEYKPITCAARQALYKWHRIANTNSWHEVLQVIASWNFGW